METTVEKEQPIGVGRERLIRGELGSLRGIAFVPPIAMLPHSEDTRTTRQEGNTPNDEERKRLAEEKRRRKMQKRQSNNQPRRWF